MAPVAQQKLDFPIRKTRSSMKSDDKIISKNKENLKSPVKINLTNKIVENSFYETGNTKSRTPTKRHILTDENIPCSPSKILKDNKTCKVVVRKLAYSPQVTNKCNFYQTAKQSLNLACSDRILGRENEIKELSTFLDDHLGKKKSGSLYVSGPPGTGKTACLTHILKALSGQVKFKSVYINCMTLKKSQDIFKKLAFELGLKCRDGKECLRSLEKTFTSSKNMVLLVLDEIDHLDSKNQEVLYSIYEWCELKNSKLVLVGVANALDLTDRVLPRLKSLNMTPKLLSFPPYTKDQIVGILKDRLNETKSSDTKSVFKPIAIQFCARKVAACAGDIRKALDVCRRAIELVEADIRKPILKSSNKDVDAADEFKQVDLRHISSVMQNVYESRIVSNDQGFSELFPLQQKFLIGSLVLIMKKGNTKEITVGKLHEVYSRVCKKHQISEVSQSDFDSLCSMLDSRGIIGVKVHKERRLSKIKMKIDENEVERVIQDQTLLARILSDDSCLKR